MKKTLILFSLLLLSSCTSLNIENEKNPEFPNTKTEKISQKEKNLPGKKLLEHYSKQELIATKGDFVFGPDKTTLEKFYKDENNPLIYTKHKLIKTKIGKSLVSDNYGEEFEVENSLLIPISITETVKKGDIVLTNYPSSKGLSYAFVINANDPKAPLVKYLHKNLNGKKDYIPENSFVKINGDFVKGAQLVVKEGASFLGETMLCDCNGFVLTISQNGTINLRNKLNAIPVAFLDGYKAGDDVFVNINGSYTPATINEINKEEALVSLLYKENATNKQGEFNILEITKNLD